jgi:Mrp family chromosome partitioning ATPase/capsular polysaccharide biosynthesis protein
MEQSNTVQLRVSDYLRPLLSRWWLIVVAVIVATGGVYAYYAHKPNVYQTSDLVYYQDPGNVVTGLPTAPQTDRTVLDAATLLDSRSNAAAVASAIHYRGTPDELLTHVSIGSRPGSDFITISVSAGRPVLAAAIANAFASNLVSSLSNQVIFATESALRLTQAQLVATPHGPAGVVQRSDLQAQINRLQLSLKVPTLVAKQVASAAVPGSPSSPKPARNALFALLVSLVAAIALAYGLERFDRRLKTPDEMERAYGRSLLAVLPHTDDPAPVHDGAPALGHDFREPFRILRTNVELESLDTPARTIVISSAMPGEGKSTVVRNMALAAREAGLRVAVVDLDLRNPRLASLFGVTPEYGMTEVLRHDVDVEHAELKIDVGIAPFDELFRAMLSGRPAPSGSSSSNGGNGHAPAAEHAEITLISAGARPANAPAVLASARLTEVLDELRERYDLVLIDSAPLLAVTDTVPLLRYADAALLVGRLDVTTRDTAKRLMEFVGRVPDMNMLGIVANDLHRLDASGYGYGYGYAYRDKQPGDDAGARGGRRRRSRQPA